MVANLMKHILNLFVIVHITIASSHVLQKLNTLTRFDCCHTNMYA